MCTLFVVSFGEACILYLIRMRQATPQTANTQPQHNQAVHNTPQDGQQRSIRYVKLRFRLPELIAIYP